MRLYFFIIMFLFYNLLAYTYCFDEAAKEYNIPKQLLVAIARVESNLKPNAINYNKNGTFDYGVMQINSSWYFELGDEKWHKLADPCENVKTGAMILSRCIKKFGYNWKAIDCYNKGSKAKENSIYVIKVYKALTSAVLRTTD